MAEYTSGQINFAGLGNGTDFNQLIEGMVDIERYQIRRMESWKASWEIKMENFRELNTQMLSLKTNLQGMDTVNEFLTKQASTTDSSILTATAGADADVGSHSLVVNQLARNDIFMTNSGVSELTTSVFSATSNFTFSYGTEVITLSNVAAGTTMEGLVNLINNDPDARDKVRATTIYDGQDYYLQMYGMDLGADNQLVLSNTGSFVFSASDFVETQNAQDSQIRIDGFPSNGSGKWIERSTNSISDVINGVTLNLKDADPSRSVEVGVTVDTDGIKENVQTFVDQVNEVRTLIKQMSAVDETTGEGSILTGNYGVQIISQSLKDITASIGIGFQYYTDTNGQITGDKYSSLSQIGILTDAEEGSATAGLLQVDYEALDAALNDDPDKVAELFAADHEGQSRSSNYTYVSHIDGITDGGNYDVQVTTDGSGIASATINGNDATIDTANWTITGQSGTPEAGLTIRVDNRTLNTTTEGVVSLKVGKAPEMIDKLKQLTNSTDGPLHILEENYTDITDAIDRKIDREERRISIMEQTLREKYARLDSLLGYYDNLQASLGSQISQLSS